MYQDVDGDVDQAGRDRAMAFDAVQHVLGGDQAALLGEPEVRHRRRQETDQQRQFQPRCKSAMVHGRTFLALGSRLLDTTALVSGTTTAISRTAT
jgi:hypothetical protein